VLKVVEGILKKHLDDAVKEYEREVEMTVVSPFEILWQQPSFEERRALARELITTIRGVDLSTLRIIPTQEEAEKFVKSIMPYESYSKDEEYVRYHAQALIGWLEYRPQELVESLV